MRKNNGLIWLLVLAVVVGGVAYYFSSLKSAGVLWAISQGGKWFLPVLLVAALIDSLNPCAFSILLLTIAFLFSLGKARREVLKVGGTYIFGIFLLYILIGLGIVQALHLFNIPHFMSKVGATLIILWGVLELLNHFFPNFPIRLGIPHAAHSKMATLMNKASVPTAFVLGALVGACEFPCTGGPYLLVLGMLHDTATKLAGFGYLLLYNLIFILPLVIVLLIASDRLLLEKVQAWRRSETGNMRLWTGVIMVLLGLLIFSF